MKASELIEGLKIITRTQPDAEVDAQHDIIYAGEYKPRKLTAEERARMKELNWFESEDAWAHFT